jgi:two-component system, OmpR family, phosphate regulon response regulator PhoB
VSLRILFADDSVTAQNMGKKILTEAGYEVVAVSNGAAAVKKIAEQKPDIIILDVYMPGYSGLEVCEKVRSSIATIKTPVLLTVGKMEPYKAEDANRVRADGVIIKPFEASDLLAIVKKFEERIGETPVAPPPPPTEAIRPLEEMKAAAPETNHEPPPKVMQPMVEVPDHMATSSAFSDMLGTDATRMESFYAPPLANPAPVRAEAPAVAPPARDFDLPASWRQEPEVQPTVVETPLASVAPAVVTAMPVRPVQIPVYQESQPAHFEVVPTAAPPLGDIEIPREAGLQESAEETTRNTVADHRDPDLVPTAHHIPAPATQQVAEINPAVIEMPSAAGQESPVAIEEAVEPQVIPEEPGALATEPPQPAPSLSEADFEARVAAAMAAYGQATENHDTVPHEAVSQEPAVSSSISMEDDHHAAPVTFEPQEIHHMSVEAPIHASVEASQPAPEMESIVHTVDTSTASAVSQSIAEIPAEAPAVAHAAAAGVSHESVVASVEAELPSTLQAAAQEIHAATQSTNTSEHDHETIAQAVHRVMERMKENLVEEIVRELKTKK